MGLIFIILSLVGGIHIPADGLPRDYELLRADGGGDASRRVRRPLLGIILVILNNNIIFGVVCGWLWLGRYDNHSTNLDRWRNLAPFAVDLPSK